MKFGTQPTTSTATDLNKDPERQMPTSVLGMSNLQSADENVPREPPVIVARPHDDPDAAVTYPTDIEPTAESLKASEMRSPVGDHLSRSHDVGEGSSSDISPKTSGRNNMVPASIGREICPICIVDFEEGDDIRLLPCEGKHSFHQQCVDPWLLKLSSSCPICRQGELSLPLCQKKHTSHFVIIRFLSA